MPPDELVYVVGCTPDEPVYIVGCIVVFCPDVLACIVFWLRSSGLYEPPYNVAFEHVLSRVCFVATPLHALLLSFGTSKALLTRNRTD